MAPVRAMASERAALAAAIEAWRIRSETIAAIRGAVGKAEEAAHEAGARLQRAEAAVETAKHAAADHLTAVALGHAGKPPMSIKQARAEVQDAEDDLQAARAARAALEAKLADETRFADIPERNVSEAAIAVLKASPAVAALLAEVQRLQRELADKGAALLWLEGIGALDLQNLETGNFSPAQAAVVRLRSPMIYWDFLKAATLQGAASWQAARDALMVDPRAPLPGATGQPAL